MWLKRYLFCLLGISLISAQICPATPHEMLAPTTALQIHDPEVWAELTQAKILFYALTLYQLQVLRGLSGEELKREFSRQFSAQGKGVQPHEVDWVSGFEWDRFKPGYYPFRVSGQSLVITIYRGTKRPDLEGLRIVAEGHLKGAFNFALVIIFEGKEFLKRAMDPAISIDQMVADVQWLLLNLEDPAKQRLIREGFDLIQMLDERRSARIYHALSEADKKKLLKTIGPRTIGRMLFGWVVMNPRGNLQRLYELQERETQERRQKIHQLALEVKAILDTLKLPDPEPIAFIDAKLKEERISLEIQRRDLGTLMAKNDSEVLAELRLNETPKLIQRAEALEKEIETHLRMIQAFREMSLLALATGARDMRIHFQEQIGFLEKAIEEKRRNAQSNLEFVGQLMDANLETKREMLKRVIGFHRQSWQKQIVEINRALEEVDRKERNLTSISGKTFALAGYRREMDQKLRKLGEEIRTLDMEEASPLLSHRQEWEAFRLAREALAPTLRFVKVAISEKDGKSKGRDDVLEELRAIEQAFDAVVKIYVAEREGLLINEIKSSKVRNSESLMGVDAAAAFGIQRLLEKGGSRVLFVNAIQDPYADPVAGMARRLLRDENIPLTLRAKRVLRLNLKKMPQDEGDFILLLKEVLNSVRSVGNGILVFDFDQLVDKFGSESEALSRVFQKVVDEFVGSDVPIVGLMKPDYWEFYQGHEKFVRYFAHSNTEVHLNAVDFEKFLQWELEKMARYNGVEFPQESLDEAIYALFSQARTVRFSDAEELVGRFSKMAAEAQLAGTNVVSFYRVKTEMGLFIKEWEERSKKEADLAINEDTDYEAILNTQDDLPENVRQAIRGQLKRLKDSSANSSERSVIVTYLDWLLSVPWAKRSTDMGNIGRVKRTLDADHYGMQETKSRIIEHVGVGIHTGETKGKILLLVGPPGVGKTSIGSSVARALNRKFERFSVGGMHDEAEIRGHRRTYIGAMPGRIVKALREAGTKNPVIMIDEVDKMGKDPRGDPTDALLEVLDPEQNREFRDHYLDIELDLSEVIFILTANDLSEIPRALRDRAEVIELEGYLPEEKLVIAKEHILPKLRAKLLLSRIQFSIANDDVIRLLITQYTREAGVRSLERVLETLMRKGIVDLLEKKSSQITIDGKKVEEYLGPPKAEKPRKLAQDTVGVATGLSVSLNGGDTLICETKLVPLEGEAAGAVATHLTGNIKEVMQESAEVALSLVRGWYKRLGIDASKQSGKLLHVHFPDGATPKEGPSAGLVATTALVSLMTGLPVDRDVAMTGEISLREEVLPIGGLKQKIYAAFEAGMTKVIIPKGNEKDLGAIPEEVLKALKIVAVSRVEEAWREAIPGLENRLQEVERLARIADIAIEGGDVGRTKIRRNDPDLTRQEREELEARLAETTYFTLTDLIRNEWVKQNLVIRIVQGKEWNNLDLGVANKRVYAYSKGNVIYMTERLLIKLSAVSELLESLILHEVVEMLGGTHQEAEDAELRMGKVDERLSTLDLALEVLAVLEAGIVMTPEVFLRHFVQGEPSLDAKKLVTKILEDASKDVQLHRVSHEIFRRLENLLEREQGKITLRTDLYVVERGQELLSEEISDETARFLHILSRLGYSAIELHGLVARNKLNAGFLAVEPNGDHTVSVRWVELSESQTWSNRLLEIAA